MVELDVFKAGQDRRCRHTAVHRELAQRRERRLEVLLELQGRLNLAAGQGLNGLVTGTVIGSPEVAAYHEGFISRQALASLAASTR